MAGSFAPFSPAFPCYEHSGNHRSDDPLLQAQPAPMEDERFPPENREEVDLGDEGEVPGDVEEPEHQTLPRRLPRPNQPPMPSQPLVTPTDYSAHFAHLQNVHTTFQT